MINILIVGYGSIGKKHLENFLQFKDIQLTVYTKRNDLQSLKKKGIKISNSLKTNLFILPPSSGNRSNFNLSVLSFITFE